MPGWVELSFEREPDYFAATRFEGERHGVLVAREHGRSVRQDETRIVGVCARASRRVFVDGEPHWLGYLGQFRAIEAWQRGYRAYRLLKAGFDQVERLLRRPDELPFDITSILSDNYRAKRLLSAGLRGMPRYQWLSGFHTLVFRSGGSVRGEARRVQPGTAVGLAAIAHCLRRNYRRYQFAPVWDEQSLADAGLGAGDFFVLRDAERVTACLAIWDQRAFKQVVVRAYRPPIGPLRPLINIVARVLGNPTLPPRGQPLRHGWLSHLACDEDAPSALQALLAVALADGRRRGLDQLMLGLADDHPLLSTARAIRRHLDYRSDIYLVHRENDAINRRPSEQWLTKRPLLLEPATM